MCTITTDEILNHKLTTVTSKKQGAYEMLSVFLLFVLSVCEQDFSKSWEQSFMKFMEQIPSVLRNFGYDLPKFFCTL